MRRVHTSAALEIACALQHAADACLHACCPRTRSSAARQSACSRSRCASTLLRRKERAQLQLSSTLPAALRRHAPASAHGSLLPQDQVISCKAERLQLQVSSLQLPLRLLSCVCLTTSNLLLEMQAISYRLHHEAGVSTDQPCAHTRAQRAGDQDFALEGAQHPLSALPFGHCTSAKATGLLLSYLPRVQVIKTSLWRVLSTDI